MLHPLGNRSAVNHKTADLFTVNQEDQLADGNAEREGEYIFICLQELLYQ